MNKAERIIVIVSDYISIVSKLVNSKVTCSHDFYKIEHIAVNMLLPRPDTALTLKTLHVPLLSSVSCD